MIPLEEVFGALDVLPEPILLIEADGRIVGVNRPLASMLGAAREELSGRQIGDILDDAGKQAELIGACAGRSVGSPGVVSLRPTNGPPISFHADSAIYQPNASSPSLMLIRLLPREGALSSEIERRKNAEARLEQAAEMSREAEHRKDEFLATLAHELRNPLAPIRNSMQIMQASEGDVAMISAARVIVERQLKHLSRLIEDLLDISRITQGKIELRTGPTDLGSIIQMALEISRPQLEGKQHPLQIELASEGLTLEGDRNRLAQAFANLLSNASKYSGAGKPIRIEAAVEGEQTVVRVIDRGIGIPSDMLERIFELFVQVDRTGSGTHDGLGIGLSLVKRIVELHGGSVAAFSEGQDRGSRFTVRLPRSARSESSIVLPPPERLAASGRRLRILVADDNRDAAQTLAMLLRLDGHDVRAVQDGSEALVIGDAFHPQLLLLDIGMPVLDGYETARQVRERDWGRKAQLAALTGWGQDSDRKKALDAGFQYHLVKPAEPEALRAVIDSVIAD